MNKVNHIFKSVAWSNSFNLSDSACLFVQHIAIVLLQSHDFSDVKTECNRAPQDSVRLLLILEVNCSQGRLKVTRNSGLEPTSYDKIIGPI